MLAGMRAAISAAILTLCRRFQKRPNQPENGRNGGQQQDTTAGEHDQPEAGILHAEQAAIHTTLREISAREENHQAGERGFWERQIRAAHRLNWITGVGAAVGVLGLFFVFGSFVLAIRASHDAETAAKAAGRQADAAIEANRISNKYLVASQRAYLIPKKFIPLVPQKENDGLIWRYLIPLENRGQYACY
jgi:hypothetical protein